MRRQNITRRYMNIYRRTGRNNIDFNKFKRKIIKVGKRKQPSIGNVDKYEKVTNGI
jgi:hypothetical protein